MTHYFSTFISGFQNLIANALKQQLSDVKILLLLDGLIVYTTNASIEKINKIRFFNNNYISLLTLNQLKNPSVEFIIQSTIKNRKLLSNLPLSIGRNNLSFRIMASVENQTVAINKTLLHNTENFFSRELGIRVNRNLSDIEIWFILRSEGIGLTGIRLRDKNHYGKPLTKGELRPELANLLCLLSNPEKNDVFLDPFAGFGAIPLERLKIAPCKEIIASDIDKGITENLKKRLNKNAEKVKIRNWDALHLSEMPDETVNKIVTDPPWGFFSHQNTDMYSFYTSMLAELSRVIKREGLLIILTAQKEAIEKALLLFTNINLIEKFDILVSGKKAAVYKIKKHN